MAKVITADTWVKRQLQLIRICIDIRYKLLMICKFLIVTMFRLYKNTDYLSYDAQFNVYFRSSPGPSSQSRQHGRSDYSRYMGETLVTINSYMY